MHPPPRSAPGDTEFSSGVIDQAYECIVIKRAMILYLSISLTCVI